MPTVVAYTNEAGGVSLLSGGESIEALLAQSPAGAIAINDASLPPLHLSDAWEIADGVVVLNVQKQMKAEAKACTDAIQHELDRQAKDKGYDNIISACSYAAQPEGAPFRAEGAAFLAWRSDVWSQAYAHLARVNAGEAPMPTPTEAVAMMPALVLP